MFNVPDPRWLRDGGTGFVKTRGLNASVACGLVIISSLLQTYPSVLSFLELGLGLQTTFLLCRLIPSNLCH